MQSRDATILIVVILSFTPVLFSDLHTMVPTLANFVDASLLTFIANGNVQKVPQ